jgi:ethanolamine utilization protein EutQ (cupin superfamily)
VVVFDEDSWKVRVITQADLARAGVVETIEKLAKQLAYSYARCDPSFPKEVDLVLELVDEGNSTKIGYYFVHHENKCLFWLEDFDGMVIFRECSGVTELSHKRQSSDELSGFAVPN